MATRPAHRYLRFGLRTLLVMMVVIAIPMAWKVNRLHQQRRLSRIVTEAGGQVFYDYVGGMKVPPPGPAWIRGILGDDVFCNLEGISLVIPSSPGDADFYSALSQCSSLKNIMVSDATDEQIEQVVRFLPAAVVDVSFDGTFGDEGAARLSALAQLQSISLDGNFGDQGLSTLGELTKLEVIYIVGNFTDEGIAKLSGLPNLTLIDMTSLRLTGQAFANLRPCKSLSSVALRTDQKIPPEALEALPECNAYLGIPWRTDGLQRDDPK